jgi:DNA-directed RNA polymerase subunit RPC12/RpoP
MERHCSKCKAQMESPWSFCPHCGAARTNEIPKPAAPAEPEKAPVEGGFSGLLFGVVAAPVLIIPGTLMCLTGLGAFLGVPMIIAGVFAPLIGPLIGLGALKGKCPWCGAAVSSIANSREFGCQACSKRIAISHRAFVRAA